MNGDPDPSQGTLVFDKEEQWKKFSDKYIPGVFSIATMFNKKVDFNQKDIIYISSVSAKSGYGLSIDLQSILLINNEIKPQYSDKPGKCVTNRGGAYHPSIILLTVSKGDIPDNIKNMYNEYDFQ